MQKVVDAQVHLWLAESADRLWPAGGTEFAEKNHRAEPLSPSALLDEMAVAGVDRAVLVPPFFEGYRNDYCMTTARAHPENFRVMARVDLRRDDWLEILESTSVDPLVAGIRLLFIGADAGSILDNRAKGLWCYLESQDVPVMIFAPGQTADLATVVRDHPALKIAVDHLNIAAALDSRELVIAITALVELSQYESVSVKASALSLISRTVYPHSDLHESISRVVDAFGADRVFWGSDLSRLNESYGDSVRLFRDGIPGLSGIERQKILGGSLSRWLGWSDNE